MLNRLLFACYFWRFFLLTTFKEIEWQKGAIKITKHLLIAYLISFTAFSSVAGLFLFNPFGTKTAEAAWFNDQWAYRQAIPITTHSGAEVNVYDTFQLDTATLITAGKLQSACQDIRITDQRGNLLKYHVGRTNACNNAATTIDFLIPSFDAGAQTYYVYYGNPSAPSADSGAFAQSLCGNSCTTNPTLGTVELTPTATLYWKFDDGQGTAAKDSTQNAFDGTLAGSPAWVPEDRCISGKCLYFDGVGANNDRVTKADNDRLDFAAGELFSTSLWARHSGAAAASFLLTKASATGTGTFTGYKVYMDGSGNYCFAVKDGTNAATACSSGTNYADNKWHFIEGVRAANNSTKIYIDGLKVATDTTNVSSTTANAGSVTVGIDTDSAASEYNGYIDEVKIYRDNTARTDSQVQADYGSRSNPEGLTEQSGNNSQNLTGALSNGLVGYWKLDEASGQTKDCTASPFSDSSGNSNNGKSCPSTTGPDGGGVGKFGNSVLFDNTNDYIEVPNATNLQVTTPTIAAWVRLTTNTTGTRTVLQKSTAAGTDGYSLDINSGAIRFCAAGGCVSSSGTLTAGTWAHVVATFDGTTTRLYLNGALDTTSTTVTSVPTNSLVLRMGANSSAANLVNGNEDEVRVYNRALSTPEVSQLYNWAPGPVGYWKLDDAASPALDSSGNGYNGTWAGDTVGGPGKYGKAAKLDGNGDFITAADQPEFRLPSGGAITIMAWAKVSSAAAANLTILGKHISDGSNNSYSIGMSFGCLYFSFRDSGFVGPQATGSCNLRDDKWHHIAATYNSGTGAYVAYLDGKVDVTGTTTNSGAGSGDVVTIGDSLLGSVDEAKIYNYARTQTQIIEDMNAGHPAPGSPVGSAIAYWKFDEGYGTTAHDSNTGTGLIEDLTLSSATSAWTTAGKFGKAFNAGGARWAQLSDSASTGEPADNLDFIASDDLSISFWMKTASSTNPSSGVDEYLIKKGTITNTGTVGYAVYSDNNGKINFGIRSTSGVWGASSPGTPSPNDVVTSTADLYDTNWHHIVIEKSGTSNLKMYVDGLLNATTTIANATGTLANDVNFFVGDDDADATNSFNGILDEVKVFKSALTADQVKLDMNRGSVQILGALSDKSGNQANSQDNEYCVPGDSTTCTAPVGRWDFEDNPTGTSAEDISGNSNTGTLTNGPTFTKGKIGKGVSFTSASNHYIVAADSTSLSLTGNLSISAWINTTTTGQQGIVEKTTGDTTAGYKFRLDSSNFLSGATCDGSACTTVTDATSAVSTNTWTFVEMTYDGSNIRLYKNGILVKQGADTRNPTDGTSKLNISGQGNGTSAPTTGFFSGKIDAVKVFGYARSAAQVAWDYNRGGPVAWYKMDECQGTTLNDSSSNSLSGTISLGASGTTSAGTCGTAGSWFNGASGKRNYSLAFDGNDDYSYVTDVTKFPTADYTFATWVNVTALDSFVFDLNDKMYGWVMSNGKIRHRYPSGANLDSATTLSTGRWYHLAFVRRSNTIYTYINGVQDANTASDSTAASFTSCYLLIGADMNTCTTAWPTSKMNGMIDDFRVYNYGLTDSQIKTLYNNGAINFAPSTGAP